MRHPHTHSSKQAGELVRVACCLMCIYMPALDRSISGAHSFADALLSTTTACKHNQNLSLGILRERVAVGIARVCLPPPGRRSVCRSVCRSAAGDSGTTDACLDICIEIAILNTEFIIYSTKVHQFQYISLPSPEASTCNHKQIYQSPACIYTSDSIYKDLSSAGNTYQLSGLLGAYAVAK